MYRQQATLGNFFDHALCTTCSGSVTLFIEFLCPCDMDAFLLFSSQQIWRKCKLSKPCALWRSLVACRTFVMSSASFCIVALQCSLPSAPLPKFACRPVTSLWIKPTALDTNQLGTHDVVPWVWPNFSINCCIVSWLRDCARSRQDQFSIFLMPQSDIPVLRWKISEHWLFPVVYEQLMSNTGDESVCNWPFGCHAIGR